MKVAIVAKLRSGPMIEFRKQRQLSQRKAAELLGISFHVWSDLERLDFRYVSWDTIVKLAAALDVEPTQLASPPLLKTGARLGAERVAFVEADSARLYASCKRMILPSPADVVEEADAKKALAQQIAAALQTLPFRQREVLKCRYGLDGKEPLTLQETGRVFKVTAERIRQAEIRALRHLQSLSGMDRLDER